MTFLSGLENAPKIIIFVEVQKRFISKEIGLFRSRRNVFNASAPVTYSTDESKDSVTVLFELRKGNISSLTGPHNGYG